MSKQQTASETGGEALSTSLAEKAAADDARVAKLQAQHEAEQDAMLRKRKEDAMKREQDTLRMLGQQARHLTTGTTA